MGVRILHDAETGIACLYCSTTQWAFGPLFESREDAAEFLSWLRRDPRDLPDRDLERAFSDWLGVRRLRSA
jgi:hypothetical protein